MTQLFANNAASTLASGITNSATSLTLATGQGALFPSITGSDYFLLTLTQAATESSWEIVKVTARSGDALTIVRAQEGTTAAAWASGDKAEARLTAGTMGGTGTGSIVRATTPTITGTIEVKAAIAAANIDLATANVFTKTITANTTFTLSNVPATGSVASFLLDLTNGAAFTVTWFGGIKWAGGTAPTLTAAGRDMLGFVTHDGGTTWNGFVLGKALA